jgi:hypothetical protein
LRLCAVCEKAIVFSDADVSEVATDTKALRREPLYSTILVAMPRPPVNKYNVSPANMPSQLGADELKVIEHLYPAVQVPVAVRADMVV